MSIRIIRKIRVPYSNLASRPTLLELAGNGVQAELFQAGAGLPAGSLVPAVQLVVIIQQAVPFLQVELCAGERPGADGLFQEAAGRQVILAGEASVQGVEGLLQVVTRRPISSSSSGSVARPVAAETRQAISGSPMRCPIAFQLEAK